MTSSELKEIENLKRLAVGIVRKCDALLPKCICDDRANSQLMGAHHWNDCPLYDVVLPKEEINRLRIDTDGALGVDLSKTHSRYPGSL